MTSPTEEPFELADRPESWPVAETVDLHREDWVMALRADRIRPPGRPEAEPFRRWVLEHPGAAIVLAVDDDDRVLCLSQYRHPAQRRFIELPAGLCDVEGEDPLEVAKRELREEAGYEATDWTHLGSPYSSPGILAEVQHLYLARGLTESGRGDFDLVHEEADMTLHRVPFGDLYDAVLAGTVADGPVVTAVLLARARGLVGS